MKHVLDTAVWLAVIGLTIAAGWAALAISRFNREFWESLS